MKKYFVLAALCFSASAYCLLGFVMIGSFSAAAGPNQQKYAHAGLIDALSASLFLLAGIGFIFLARNARRRP